MPMEDKKKRERVRGQKVYTEGEGWGRKEQDRLQGQRKITAVC